jgi:hypothetical protein
MLLRLFNLLALLLLSDQLLERFFASILELLRREMPDLAPDDMDRQIEHVVGDLLIGYIAEILLFRFFRSSARISYG